MYYVLESGKHEIRAFIDVRDNYEHECPVLVFLRDKHKERQYSGAASGFKPLFKRYAQDGRKGVTTELFHCVDDDDDIWEFIKGQLRVFCFKDGSCIVLTHGALKKTQKVDRKEVAKAVAAKTRYFEGKNDGSQ